MRKLTSKAGKIASLLVILVTTMGLLPTTAFAAPLLDADFENSNWKDDWTTDCDQTETYSASPTHSVECSENDHDKELTSKDLNTSSYSAFRISFKYRVDDIDGDDNVKVQYYNGSNYNNIEEIGDDTEDTWLTYEDVVTDSQYMRTNFRLRIRTSSIDDHEHLWVDDVLIESVDSSPDNPDLEAGCGLDIVLALDSSDSLTETALQQVRDAAHAFANAFLPETTTLIGVVDFDTQIVGTPLDLTDDETDISNAIDAIGHTGTTELTNWEAALKEATKMLENASPYTNDRDDTKHADLIVIVTDGDPTTYGYPTSQGSYGGTEPDPEDINNAIAAADAAKTSDDDLPIRIVAVGVGGAPTVANLIAISGPNVYDGTPPPALTVDTDVVTTGFDQLANKLAALASELCGGTITVHKIIDADGDLGTTDDQTTSGDDVAGWTFTPSVTGGSSDPTSDTTDTSGDTGAFDISISGGTATVNIVETVKSGFDLFAASCAGATSNGSFDYATNSVNGIAVDQQDIVSCTFYNQPPPSACLPTIDFETDAMDISLAAGTVITDQWAAWGVHVTTSNPTSHPVMIFDSSNPTGNDPDLGTPNQDFDGPGVGNGGKSGQPGENSLSQGKILIISTDGDPSDPDDYAGGGTITFTFDEPTRVEEVHILDIEETGSKVKAFNAVSGGTKLAEVNMQIYGDNSFQIVPVNAVGVRRLEIIFGGSGGVSAIVFCPGSIGDYVWIDESGDGEQGALPYPPYDLEVGINDIELELWSDDPNGASPGEFDLGDTRTMTMTTQTHDGSDGWYLFTGLPAGTYFVRIAPAEFDSGGTLYDYNPTVPYTGTVDTVDSNGDNPTCPYSPTIKTGECGQALFEDNILAATTLEAGSMDDLTIDFGVVVGAPPTAVTLSSFAARPSMDDSRRWLWLGLAGVTVVVAGSLVRAKRRHS